MLEIYLNGTSVKLGMLLRDPDPLLQKNKITIFARLTVACNYPSPRLKLFTNWQT